MQEVLYKQLREFHDKALSHHGAEVGPAFEAGCLAGMLSGVFEDFLNKDQQQKVIDALKSATSKIGQDKQVH